MLRFKTVKIWTLERKVDLSKLWPVRVQCLSQIHAKFFMLKYFSFSRLYFLIKALFGMYPKAIFGVYPKAIFGMYPKAHLYSKR
jgi:hypothetical protein